MVRNKLKIVTKITKRGSGSFRSVGCICKLH